MLPLARRMLCWWLGAVVVAGCSTTTTQSFDRVPDASVEAGYIASDADFSRYRRLVPRDMGIYFPSKRPLTDAQVRTIRSAFQDAFRDELEGYEIVNKPASDALVVEATLIDLRNAGLGDMPPLRPELRSLAQPGKLLFLMELRDSRSNRVLGRAADTVSVTIRGNPDDPVAAQEVADAARRWARIFREFLDRNLQHPD